MGRCHADDGRDLQGWQARLELKSDRRAQAEVAVAPKVRLHDLRRVLLQKCAQATSGIDEKPVKAKNMRHKAGGNPQQEKTQPGHPSSVKARTVASTRKCSVRTAMQVARKPRQKTEVE